MTASELIKRKRRKLKDARDARALMRANLAAALFIIFGLTCGVFGVVTLFVGPRSLLHSITEIIIGFGMAGGVIRLIRASAID